MKCSDQRKCPHSFQGQLLFQRHHCKHSVQWVPGHISFQCCVLDTSAGDPSARKTMKLGSKTSVTTTCGEFGLHVQSTIPIDDTCTCTYMPRVCRRRTPLLQYRQYSELLESQYHNNCISVGVDECYMQSLLGHVCTMRASLEFTFDCSKTINIGHHKQCTEDFPSLVCFITPYLNVAMTLSLLIPIT